MARNLPRLIVMLANQTMTVPKRTHCGESMRSGAERSSSSSSPSGNTGESFSTVVSMFTVETVTCQRVHKLSTIAVLNYTSHKKQTNVTGVIENKQNSWQNSCEYFITNENTGSRERERERLVVLVRSAGGK